MFGIPRRLSLVALGLLRIATATAPAAGAAAADTAASITTAHPALRGTIGRRLPHPIMAANATEERAGPQVQTRRSPLETHTTSPTTYVQRDLALPSNATTDEPRTGALEWAGQAAATAVPANDQSISVSSPMGNQGQSLTDQDTGIMPFGGGIVNEPGFDDAEPDEMVAATTNTTAPTCAPTPAPTYRQRRREL